MAWPIFNRLIFLNLFIILDLEYSRCAQWYTTIHHCAFRAPPQRFPGLGAWMYISLNSTVWMGRLDFVFLELSGAPLNEKLQRKNLSSTHTRRGIHRPYPTQLKQEHTSNKPGYKHHKDPREKIIYKIFKKKKLKKTWRKTLNLKKSTEDGWRLKKYWTVESRKSTKKSKKQSKWVKTIQLMRFILREWNNKRLHPLINFLMVSHFIFWPIFGDLGYSWLFLICVRMVYHLYGSVCGW